MIVAAFNIPIKYFSFGSSQFGAVDLTEYQSSDLVSSIPTTQSANNTIIENTFNSIIGTTTNTTLTSIANLATVGTITSGEWNSTVIATLYGGTGSTTWPSTNTLIYASSTNPMLGVPIGTEGQSLQLVNVGGTAGLVPQWQTASVNETEEYDFTGDFSAHSSTTWNALTGAASSFFGKLFFNGTATSTLDFSGTGQQASSTVLAVDGENGKVSWVPYSKLLVAEATSTAVSTNASTTMFAITIPANTLKAGNQAIIKGSAHIQFSGNVDDVDDGLTIALNFGQNVLVASSTVDTVSFQNLNNPEGTLDFYIIYDGTNQLGSMKFVGGAANGKVDSDNPLLQWGSLEFTASSDVTTDQLLSLVGLWTGASGNYTIKSAFAEINFR